MKTYSDDSLNHIAFPLGGIGAGMICMQGTGNLGNVSVRNEPNVHHEPNVFSAIYLTDYKNEYAKVIEGQVPKYKIFGGTAGGVAGMGNGLHGKNYGLPRFESNNFTSQFPFCNIEFIDKDLPIDVSLCAFSPFTPPNADESSYPIAGIEYTFSNPTNRELKGVYYFNAVNFMKANEVVGATWTVEYEAKVTALKNGFVLSQPPTENNPASEGYFAITTDDSQAVVNTNWFDGGWFDILTMQWNDIKNGKVVNSHCENEKSPGGSIAIPFILKPNEKKTVKLMLSWYVPTTNLRFGAELDDACSEEKKCSCGCKTTDKETHKAFYTKSFENILAVVNYWENNYDRLYKASKLFSDTFYKQSIPEEIIEAVAANLSIIKSPTILRQKDGRLWCYEGCCDTNGCCTGSCTHVWNYAQSICNLFPSLERTLRQTEFFESQNDEGHQQFRASLPIRECSHDFHAASDGQLGGIMKLYRDYLISGDKDWLKSLYPNAKKSLDYCINKWDKKREGVLKEPHHNTYDIEFWGADGMCSSFYLGALKAMYEIGNILNIDNSFYNDLYKKGKEYLETRLFNGEYFYQQAEWTTLEEKLNVENENPLTKELLLKEGPKYQYKTGCISDGVLGAWLAKVCGLGDILDREKTISHLQSVFKYNFKRSLVNHHNPQRPGYALGNDGGLILCSWPHGDKPSLPFVYSDEVWTGIEYQVASHLLMYGYTAMALDIVTTLRKRYDGKVRNPFNEYECGHFYARAMASYSLLQGYSGVMYNKADNTIYYSKCKGNFTVFLSTNDGFGLVHKNEDVIKFELCSGDVCVENFIAI